jgi:hypothetical protein
LTLIHRSAWKVNSAKSNFRFTAFSEVGLGRTGVEEVHALDLTVPGLVGVAEGDQVPFVPAAFAILEAKESGLSSVQ